MDKLRDFQMERILIRGGLGWDKLGSHGIGTSRGGVGGKGIEISCSTQFLDYCN